MVDGYLKSGCRKGVEGSSPSLYIFIIFFRGFGLLDSKDRLAGCLGLLETFTKRAFYC